MGRVAAVVDWWCESCLYVCVGAHYSKPDGFGTKAQEAEEQLNQMIKPIIFL